MTDEESADDGAAEQADTDEPVDTEDPEDAQVEGEQRDGESVEDDDIDDDIDGSLLGDDDASDGCQACADIDEDEMLVVFDRNKDFPFKQGNPYSRVCPDCGSRTFTSKAYWANQEVPYVILKGEDTPRMTFRCPHDDCAGLLVGPHYNDDVDTGDLPGTCPTCEGDIEWEED